MISIKCSNCGAELSIDTHGNLICPYCGSQSFLSDKGLKEYKELRLNMLNHLKNENDERHNRVESSSIWDRNELISFVSIDGKTINIRYSFYYELDGVKTYITKDSVVNIFDKNNKDKIEKTLAALDSLRYPSADIKGLAKYFPRIKARMSLLYGSELLAYTKPENTYPLFAFGNLKPKHVAWIVSRMENFCCLFEFSEIVHKNISTDTVFINPDTHEAYLLGGWWNTKKKSSPNDNEDLYALRKVADNLLGEYKGISPELFIKFIKSSPSADAYTDFEVWDNVIEEGFGGHKFTKFEEE